MPLSEGNCSVKLYCAPLRVLLRGLGEIRATSFQVLRRRITYPKTPMRSYKVAQLLWWPHNQGLFTRFYGHVFALGRQQPDMDCAARAFRC